MVSTQRKNLLRFQIFHSDNNFSLRLDDHFCIDQEVLSLEDHGVGVEEEILFSEPGLFLEIHGTGIEKSDNSC